MIDPFSEKLIATVFAQVFQTCYKSLLKSAKWVAIEGKERDIFGIAARRYAQQFEERYNMIRIFGMEKPVPLRNIYVRINVLERIIRNQRISIEELEAQFDRDRRTFGIRRQTKTGSQIVDTIQKFIVLGKPGAGKTTLLKYLAFQTLDGKTRKKRIPIFVSLKDFSDSSTSLIDFIVDQFDICQFPDAKPFILKILEKGKCQILLDGLDEVSKKKENSIIKQLLDFSDKFDKNQFIISCRIAAYNHWFHKFTDVEIADFSNEQIKTFINNWFGEETDVAELCWKKLNQNSQIKELASIPLLLTLLCLAFDETMDFPQNRAELYKEALDALLKKWDSTRRITREEIYKHLSLRRKEALFSKIAAETFENGEYFLLQRVLEKKIFEFIQHLPEAKDETLEPDSEYILQAIEAQHGIFIQRAKGIYSFSHLTFQEYFTGKYIVDNATEGTLERLIENHLFDDKWREVFLLTSGMLYKADEFLLLIYDKIQQLAKHERLSKYLQTVSFPKNNDQLMVPAFVGRIIAIINRIHKNSENVSLDLGLDFERVSKLDNELNRNSNKSREIALTIGMQLSKNIDLSTCKNLAIQLAISDDVDPQIKKMEELELYLKANKLLLDCMNAECYVSKSTRQAILDIMFI
jgi:predicted NACHT family NTPase